MSKTPDNISLKHRNIQFELGEILSTDWVNNDPFDTAVFNAMSVNFPNGEKHFMDSVRAYKDKIKDEKLLEEVQTFCRQEGTHSREHRKYNKLLYKHRGYDQEQLERPYLKNRHKVEGDILEKSPRFGKMVLLASTVASEHFFASLGENILEGKLLGNVDNVAGDIWRWHALEEVEHKAVAIDVFNHMKGSDELRRKVMMNSAYVIIKSTLQQVYLILKHDKQLWKWNTLKGLCKFFFSKKGFIRLHIPAYRAYFKKDFHPWDYDNSQLINEWTDKLA